MQADLPAWEQGERAFLKKTFKYFVYLRGWKALGKGLKTESKKESKKK